VVAGLGRTTTVWGKPEEASRTGLVEDFFGVPAAALAAALANRLEAVRLEAVLDLAASSELRAAAAASVAAAVGANSLLAPGFAVPEASAGAPAAL
jgi:hypothetical protein